MSAVQKHVMKLNKLKVGVRWRKKTVDEEWGIRVLDCKGRVYQHVAMTASLSGELECQSLIVEVKELPA